MDQRVAALPGPRRHQSFIPYTLCRLNTLSSAKEYNKWDAGTKYLHKYTCIQIHTHIQFLQTILSRKPISPWSPFPKITKSHLESIREQSFIILCPWMNSPGLFPAQNRSEILCIHWLEGSNITVGDADSHQQPGLRRECWGHSQGLKMLTKLFQSHHVVRTRPERQLKLHDQSQFKCLLI